MDVRTPIDILSDPDSTEGRVSDAFYDAIVDGEHSVWLENLHHPAVTDQVLLGVAATVIEEASAQPRQMAALT